MGDIFVASFFENSGVDCANDVVSVLKVWAG